MRVTKVMREYVEKQLDEKRYALGKQNRASYEARRKECIAAVKNKVEECRAEVDEILRAYNMDIPQEEDDCRGWSHREVVAFYDLSITLFFRSVNHLWQILIISTRFLICF